MPPSPVQLEQIHAAILDAFDRAGLNDLLLFHLNEQLDHITGDQGLRVAATAVVQHYNRAGRLKDLIAAMLADRPQNPLVVRLHAAAHDWDFSRATGTGDWEWLWVNVPPRPNLVVGRVALLNNLVKRLISGQSAALSADGLPGVGKTTLAIELAHHERVQARFADGVLWAGLGPNADVAAIQQAWADALGADLTGLGDPLARRARLNAAMADRRLLLVLDDAWEIGDAQALRGSGPHVAHVLTTRNGSLARDFAGAKQAVKVPVLEPQDAWNLLQELAPEACAPDLDAARELADAVGGLPLAIELLAGYLGPDVTFFPDLSKAAIAELQNPAARLALAKERLGGDGASVTLDAVIALSVDDLRRMNRMAARAFLALGAFAPKPATFDRGAAEYVTGATKEILGLLVARNLLEIAPGDLFSIHQVLGDYASHHLSSHWMRMLPSKWRPNGPNLKHRQHYYAIANVDRNDWKAIAAAFGQITHAWNSIRVEDVDVFLRYYNALRMYFNLRGLHTTQIAWIERVLASTKEPRSQARLLNNLGYCYDSLGARQEALQHYLNALALTQQIRDCSGEATTLCNIGTVYSSLGEKQRALEYYKMALPLHQQVGDKAGEAATLNNIGT